MTDYEDRQFAAFAYEEPMGWQLIEYCDEESKAQEALKTATGLAKLVKAITFEELLEFQSNKVDSEIVKSLSNCLFEESIRHKIKNELNEIAMNIQQLHERLEIIIGQMQT